MKGVLFSADFAIDDNNDPRLLELNTDTIVYSAFTSSLALNNLTDVINANSDINEFHVLYKRNLHGKLVELLSSSVAANCSNVSTIGTTLVDQESIYPTSPDDADTKFILRLVYDENAVFDSTHTKNNVNMLKLMYDNNATSSIGEFYHSSSLTEIDTLTGTVGSSDFLPDYVVKSAGQPASVQKFYAIGNDITDSSQIINLAKSQVDSTKYVEKYYYSPDQVTNNKIKALRSYNIIYGSNLDVIKLASGSYDAVFNFSTGSSFKDTVQLNEISNMSFY